jgi:hypothetical protein
MCNEIDLGSNHGVWQRVFFLESVRNLVVLQFFKVVWWKGKMVLSKICLTKAATGGKRGTLFF